MIPCCPYDHPDGQKHRMYPRIIAEKQVQMFCPACKAAGPIAETFMEARAKSMTRAETALEWHKRAVDPPQKRGRYLCKYMFTKMQEASESPENVFYGVIDWIPRENRFQLENANPGSMRLVVLEWMDYEGGKAS